MNNRFLLIVVACQSLLLFSGKVAHAAGVDDTEVGMEETISDSDAHKEAARQAKERADNEKKDVLLAKEHARVAAEEAKAKRKEVAKSIVANDAKYQEMRIEDAKLKHEIKKMDGELVDLERSIHTSQDRVDAAKETQEGLEAEKADHLAKKAALDKAHDEVTKDLIATKKNLAQAQAEADNAHAKEILAGKNLQVAKSDALQEKLKIEAKIAHLRARYEESVERTKAMEREMDVAHQKTVKLQSTAKDQEEVVTEAEKRLTEATDKWRNADKQLANARAQVYQEKVQVESKAESLNARADVTSDRAKAAEAEAQVIRQKAEAHEAATRKVVKAEPWAPVPEPSLAGVSASDANAMTLKRDCKVHDQPSVQSGTLAVKLGGESLNNSQGKNGSWITFKMDDGQTGFIAASCF